MMTMFVIVHHDVEAPPAPLPFSPLELCPLSSQNAAFTKRAVKVHGTYVCLEPFKQLFYVHRRDGRNVQISC
jgi:hypothetical protein